ncbi:MAG: flagellar hook-basal body complex protein FliE, partial [Tissierellales bacterium]
TNDNNLQFSSLLKDALNKVNALQLQSDEYKQLLATGDVDNLHDVTIAAEKASIALQLTLAIRNKVVEAYQEIMRMQV